MLRSEEDWRVLFDTLYQQEQEEAKAAAASAAAASASRASNHATPAVYSDVAVS